jgi:hypothetical protein
MTERVDKHVEYLGIVTPTILAAGFWYWLFRKKKEKTILTGQ